MSHSIAWARLFGLSLCVASGLVFAQAPIACGVIGEKEVLALVGGPLGEVDKGESKPTTENDHTHGSWCKFYAKGYDERKASGPPERGLTLQLQGKRNNADAKKYYAQMMGSLERMAKSSPPGAKLSPLSDMGEAAMMEVNDIYYLATIHFLKGSVYGIINVQKKAATADERVEIARAAAKLIIAKLP